MSKMSRRTWLGWFGGVVPAATFIACSNNKATPIDAGPDAPPGTPVTTIADNHSHAPHVMTVSQADIDAGVDKTYDIMGAANHTHSVTITAAQFATIKAGQAVGDLSTPGGIDGHTHCCVTVVAASGSGSGSATC